MTLPAAYPEQHATHVVAQPGYRPEELTVGIVHFGVGNFHRAHEAMFIDRLLALGETRDWAICGVGLMPGDVAVRDALVSQGMRYTLVERAPDGSVSARSIASIVEYIHAADDADAVIERLAAAETRIVSLTVTEGGYNISDITGEFDATNERVLRDLAPGATPSTVFGLVYEGLRRRREQGLAPFTVVSCDNVPENGDVARTSFVAFARLRDPAFADWMAAQVPFPNSMVDRITPVTTDEDRDYVLRTCGVEDAWPVVCESFAQWVLEDRFASGRPALERVGVQLVPDVRPYEKMKLRLLNAGHQAIAYFGYLLGYRYAHEAVDDPDIAAFVRAYMTDEAEPTLDDVPGIDLPQYESDVLDRFSNPYVRDTLLRLATDASDRIPKFVLPVVFDRRELGEDSPLSAAIVASWAAFLDAIQNDGAVEVTDQRAGEVAAAVRRQERDPIGFLRDPRLFGDLAESPGFADQFATTYRDITTSGVRPALQALIEASARS